MIFKVFLWIAILSANICAIDYTIENWNDFGKCMKITQVTLIITALTSLMIAIIQQRDSITQWILSF